MFDITQIFEKAIQFIDRNRKYTSVLVHCYAGVSRSASCVIAYLMTVYKWPLEKCLWFCR
jgi:protein-tyrosine phosphatase